MHEGIDGRCSLRIEACRPWLGQHEQAFEINPVGNHAERRGEVAHRANCGESMQESGAVGP
eukprot:10597835-Heterocapsa_arctica.AAC.1